MNIKGVCNSHHKCQTIRQTLITNFPGINGIANVLGEKLIPLNVL